MVALGVHGLYSKCVYDLSDGPVRIATPVPESYWSMSVYASNTDFVAVVNDRELPEHRLDVVFALTGQPTPEGLRVIPVPGPRGVAFFRTLVPDLGSELV